MKASAIKFAAQPAAVVALAAATFFVGSASAQTTTASVQAPRSAAPALAGTQELDLYVGGFWGDNLSNSAVFGDKPVVDDDVVMGIRYGYNFTNNWGVEFSGGYSPNSVTHTVGGDVDFDLYTVDANVVYHIPTNTRFVPYVTAGIGWVWGDLDRKLVGTGESPFTTGDDDSFSANAGVGVKYFVTDELVIRLDGRYRYVDGLLKHSDSSLDTFETTVGIGWVF